MIYKRQMRLEQNSANLLLSAQRMLEEQLTHTLVAQY